MLTLPSGRLIFLTILATVPTLKKFSSVSLSRSGFFTSTRPINPSPSITFSIVFIYFSPPIIRGIKIAGNMGLLFMGTIYNF